jgi:hypothetical protein
MAAVAAQDLAGAVLEHVRAAAAPDELGCH